MFVQRSFLGEICFLCRVVYRRGSLLPTNQPNSNFPSGCAKQFRTMTCKISPEARELEREIFHPSPLQPPILPLTLLKASTFWYFLVIYWNVPNSQECHPLKCWLPQRKKSCRAPKTHAFCSLSNLQACVANS